MITAGGVGQRFGSSVPKQFQLINGKPVIEYVIDSCKKSVFSDDIIVVADPIYHKDLINKYGVQVTENGTTLNISKRNGLDFIKHNYNCKKIVVVDAVRPLIDTWVIDKTFELLGEYDAVACARKITDSLGRYGEWVVNREEYYTLFTPEGFDFELLNENFNPSSPITESIQQLPSDSKVFLNFEVPYYDKITYQSDVDKIEYLVKCMNASS